MKFLTVLAMGNAAVLCRAQSSIQKYPDRGEKYDQLFPRSDRRPLQNAERLGKSLGEITLIPDRGTGRQVLFFAVFAVFAVCAERFLAPGNFP